MAVGVSTDSHAVGTGVLSVGVSRTNREEPTHPLLVSTLRHVEFHFQSVFVLLSLYLCCFSLYLCCSDVIFCVVHWLIVLFYVVLVCKCVLPPGDHPIAVNKKKIYIYNIYIYIYIPEDCTSQQETCLHSPKHLCTVLLQGSY